MITDDAITRLLLGSTDASVWAAAFVSEFRGFTVVGAGVDSGTSPTVDEETILTWFANAIETARDHARTICGAVLGGQDDAVCDLPPRHSGHHREHDLVGGNRAIWPA